MTLLRMCPVFKLCCIYGLIATSSVLSQSTVCDSTGSGVNDCDTKQLVLLSEESARVLGKLETRISQMQLQIDAVYAIQKEMQTQQEQQRSRLVPHDCADVLAGGGTESGVYTVWLADTGRQVDVYCDMVTNGGGWLIFQRRQDGTVNFFRDWSSYKTGFGNVSGEFWLGNDILNIITSYKTYKLRFDLEDFDGNKRFAVYSSFAIWPEIFRYKTRLGSYSEGDAGDDFGYHRNREFVTKDTDNEYGCSNRHKSGWWHGHCVNTNLNGRYLRGTYASYRDGVYWQQWRDVQYSLKYADMKLRP